MKSINKGRFRLSIINEKVYRKTIPTTRTPVGLSDTCSHRYICFQSALIHISIIPKYIIFRTPTILMCKLGV